jgi:hypothetical protein
MANLDIVNSLEPRLWGQEEHSVYVVMDGASIPTLLRKLYDDNPPEFDCLFAGELEPDIAEVAPYIAKLEPDSDFTDWMMSGWGEHWGIYVVVPDELDLATVRRHLRKLNMVYGPDNQPLYFRWYDPRVLRIVLPTCDTEQLQEIFGSVLRFITEGETPEQGIVFSLVNGELVQERFSTKA